MTLETTANIATVVLAVVALVFALNNYLLFAMWWSFGHLKKIWPIETEITAAMIQVRALDGVRLSNVRVIMQATARPYRSAWNPRRPIRIHEAFILFRGSTSEVPQLSRLESAIERETDLPQMVVQISVAQLTNSDQIALLRGEALTLEIVTTQSPRSRKTVRTSYKPSEIQNNAGGDVDIQTLIANLE